MTGYGEVHRSVDGVTYTLEIRSVNNRYLKSIIKLPENVQSLESAIEKRLRAKLSRGSVTLTLRRRNSTASAAYDVNHEALARYATALSKVTLANGTTATIDLATLTSLPGVCQMPERTEEELAAEAELIKVMVSECLEHVLVMRRREGEALHDDLVKNCDAIEKQLEEVVGRAPGVLKEYQVRLASRVEQLVGEGRLGLSEDALMREVALYADRSDISEEITRLRAHVAHFRETCDHGDQVGRRLDFLAQEMLRETNTIGSKSNDSDIARHVVEMKSIVDRIKEQVQNAE